MNNISKDIVVLAGRLSIPSQSKALLFDMDGVLLDTLSFDYKYVNILLRKYINESISVSQEIIQRNFALAVPDFFGVILKEYDIVVNEKIFSLITEEFDLLRSQSNPSIHEGILEILQDAKERNLLLCVVSNNAKNDVTSILSNTGLLSYFEKVVGNDKPGILKKPAPDMYLEGARLLNVDPSSCVVIEDSVLGAQAGSTAQCFVVGVGTGANSFIELEENEYVNVAYPNFSINPDRSNHE
ncbi:MAG: HAD family phosphatase [Acidimicrobiia bacterium]|nr:HAD family phosphatase [Acidimicrobiia bacterium]